MITKSMMELMSAGTWAFVLLMFGIGKILDKRELNKKLNKKDHQEVLARIAELERELGMSIHDKEGATKQ